mmetsp:Transcript_126703/g.370232  ORF Transcript_126703/g.370232 Transcript_126703/m.370232 type:complete len:862 (+) Transcript_126703:47-2632(+)
MVIVNGASPCVQRRASLGSKLGTGGGFRDALELVDAAHRREIAELQRQVTELSRETLRLRVSLREAQQQNDITLCASIDEPHMREVTELIAAELRVEATEGIKLTEQSNEAEAKKSVSVCDYLHDNDREGTLTPPEVVQGFDDPRRKNSLMALAKVSSTASGRVTWDKMKTEVYSPGLGNKDAGDQANAASYPLWEDTETTASGGEPRIQKSAIVLDKCSLVEYRGVSEQTDWISRLDLEPVVANWLTLVDKILLVAGSKRFFEVREPWVQTDTFMQKILVKHKKDKLDFHVLDPERNGTESSRTSDARSSMRRSRVSHVISEDTGLSDIAKNTRAKVRNSSLQCLVLDPQSPQRVAWMFLGMLLVVYDIIVVPMMVFPLPENGFSTAMKWISQFFWTLDIIVTFLTGIFMDSELCTDLRQIAMQYAKSWLVMDLLVVLPLWVIEIVDVASNDGGSVISTRSPTMVFKYFRFLRILRLVRIAKFEHYLQEALAAVNSSALLLSVGIVKLMSVMIILNHLNACIWYAIGRYLPGGWVEMYDDTDIGYRYLTSMHWAITQFQGTSEIHPGMGGRRGLIERMYAVVTIIFALIFLSCFVSSLTNIMMQLESLREERTGMERAVRAYLSVHSISLGLSVRVKRYIDWKQAMNRTTSAGEKILELLPKGLQADVLTEVRGPRIVVHDFFSAVQQYHLRQFRHVCHDALENMQPAPDEWIFMPEDVCQHMYFIISGECRYIPVNTLKNPLGGGREPSLMQHMLEDTVASDSERNPHDILSLTIGHWVSEAVLWTPWEHTGGLISVRDSMLLTLGVSDFARIMRSYPPAHVSAILYARQFVAGLNRFGKTYTDVIDLESLRANIVTDA